MMLMAIIFEIPLIENNSLSKFLFLPTEKKIELSISNLNEYRFGGEIEINLLI
jgi:hypothetical protein